MPSFKKLVQFTVDVNGRLTAAAEDTTPVVKTDGSQAFTANQDMGAQRIVNAQDPVSAQDYATKNYVDSHSVSPIGNPGAVVLLAQATAAASASLNFGTLFSSLYDEYLIEFVNVVPATNSANLRMRVSSDGGTTWDSAGHYNYVQRFSGSTFASVTENLAQTSFFLGGQLSSTASLGGLNGFMRMFNPLTTSAVKWFDYEGRFKAANDSHYYELTVSGDWETSATALTGVQWFMDSGNIASGTIRIYGIAKSSGAGGLAVASATSVYRSSAQLLTHAVEAAISFDTATFDVDTMWALTPNPTRLTARQTGKFYVSGQIQLGTGFMGTVHVRIYKNGAVVARETYVGQNLSSGTESHGVGALLALTLTDYVELKVELDLQAGSGTFNVNGGADATFFSAFTTGGSGGTGDIKSDGSVPFAADESMGGHKITNLATPITSTDATNKSYVDGLLAPAPVVARVYRAAATQTIPDTTDTPISFDSVDTDPDGFWSAGSPTRMTVPSGDGGSYMVFAQAQWDPSGVVVGCFLKIRKNGTTVLAETYTALSTVTASGIQQGPAQISTLVELISGDYIEVLVYQLANPRGNATIIGGSGDTYVAMTKAGGGGGGSLPTTAAKGDILASSGTEFDVQAVGANKKVLTADSAQTLGVGWNYGGLTLLESHALSGLSSIACTSWYSTDFDDYLIEIVGVAPADGTHLPQLLLSTDGGVTYLSSYDFNWTSFPGGVAITGSLSPTLQLGDGVGLQVNAIWNASLRLREISGVTPDIHGYVGGRNSGNSMVMQIGGGFPASTTIANALKFQISSGTWASGTIRIYGVRA